MTWRLCAAVFAAFVTAGQSAATAADIVRALHPPDLAGPYGLHYPEGHLSDPVPFQLVRGMHPVVTVTVDGQLLNLLVDSGAGYVTLGGSWPDPLVRSLCFSNGLCFDAITAQLRNSPYTGAAKGGINGLIGYNLLSALPVTIDYAKREMRFGATPGAGAVRIPVTGAADDPRPFGAASIGGVPVANILFDTGSSFVRIDEQTLSRLGGKAEASGREMAFGFVTAEESQLYTVPDICVGESACIAAESVQLGGWQAIGGTFFRHFAVTIDGQAGLFALMPNEGAAAFINAREKWGLQVDLTEPVRLVQIDADTPAARAGVATIDKLVAIDGQSVTQLGYLGVHAMLEAAAVTMVTLTLERAGQRRDVVLIAE